ncbi:MAG TPA: hypothetical protein VF482_20860 [Trebonia sp.]
MRTHAAARAAILATAILFVTGCTSTSGHGAVPGSPPPVADGRYLTWNPPPDGQGPRRPELTRADARTGQIEARNTFGPGFLGVPLSAAGWLWVAYSTAEGELLLRLDPVTLVVTGELMISPSRYRHGAEIAYAGGWLWADGGDRLLRVSPDSVQPTAVIPLPGASWSGVAANPDGRFLVVGEHRNKGGFTQRRDPRTGALLT